MFVCGRIRSFYYFIPFYITIQSYFLELVDYRIDVFYRLYSFQFLLEELIVIAMIMGLFVSLLTSILFTVKKGFRVAFYLLCLGLLVFLLQEANIYNFYYCLPALYIQLTDIIVFYINNFWRYLSSFFLPKSN